MNRNFWYLPVFCSLFVLTSCTDREQTTTTYQTDTSYVISDTPGNAQIMSPPAGGVSHPQNNDPGDFEKAGRNIDEGVNDAKTATGNAIDKTGKAIDNTAQKVGHDIEQGYKNTKADIDTAINAAKENKKNR